MTMYFAKKQLPCSAILDIDIICREQSKALDASLLHFDGNCFLIDELNKAVLKNNADTIFFKNKTEKFFFNQFNILTPYMIQEDHIFMLLVQGDFSFVDQLEVVCKDRKGRKSKTLEEFTVPCKGPHAIVLVGIVLYEKKDNQWQIIPANSTFKKPPSHAQLLNNLYDVLISKLAYPENTIKKNVVNGVLYKKFEIRSGNAIDIPEDIKQIKMIFSWEIMGRKFDVDIAGKLTKKLLTLQAIVYDDYGRPIDYMFQDRPHCVKGHIKKEEDTKQRKDVVYQISLATLPDRVSSIVFTSSIYAKNMNYLRVKNSKLVVQDSVNKTTLLTFVPEDTYKTAIIWCKIFRNENKTWMFEAISHSENADSYIKLLKTIKEKYITAKPDDLKMIDEMSDKFKITGSYLDLKYRNLNQQPGTQFKTIALLQFDQFGYYLDHESIGIDENSEFSCLDQQSSIQLSNLNSAATTIVGVISGKFAKGTKAAAIFIDHATDTDKFGCILDLADEELDCLHSIAFQLILESSENQTTWIVKRIGQCTQSPEFYNWLPIIRYYIPGIDKRPKPVTITQDKEIPVPKEISDITVGVCVPGKTNVCGLSVALYDGSGLEKGNVDVLSKVSQKNVVAHLEQGDRIIFGEGEEEQIRVSNIYNDFPYRHLIFFPIISPEAFQSLVKDNDTIELRTYDSNTKKLLFVCTIPANKLNVDEEIVAFTLGKDIGSKDWKFKGILGDFRDAKIKAKALPEKPKKLIVKVLQGRDLLACDMNGKSDPFVILSFNNKKGGGVTQKKTKVVKKTLEPEWNQEFEFTIPENHDNRLELILEMYDKDFLGKSDFMGALQFPLADIQETEKKWFSLNGLRKNKKEKRVIGELQLGFEFAK